jgi:hypothetical protein
MAWRIDEQVVRGEIDNRTRGRVTGRIWLTGLETPVELDLNGNAWRDLAGRRLSFVNPEPRAGDLGRLAIRQVGVVGDCTASRKVKVPDVSHDELMELLRAKESFPWHWGNSLYLEWFSARNGRVVIESATFQLTIDPDTTWEMSASEEEEQRASNGTAMAQFMDRLAKSAKPPADELDEGAAPGDAESERELFDDDESWEAERPMTEAEAEQMQAESDRLADRIQARIEREGDDADLGKIIAEELERRRQERGEKPLTPEQEAKRSEWVDEMNRAAEEAIENSDDEAEPALRKKHPLAEQAFELSLRLHREPEERRWIPDDASEEHPLVEMINAASCAGAKLAGALNSGDWPPEIEFCATKIVRLKRARGYIDDALAAITDCLEQKLAEAGWLEAARDELTGLGTACDDLIAELRTKLDRGFD